MRAFATLLLLLLVGGGVYAWVGGRGTGFDASEGGSTMTALRAEGIDRIETQSRDHQSSLHWRDGRWELEQRGGYPAWPERVKGVIGLFAAPPAIQRIETAAAGLPAMGLADPASGAAEGTGVRIAFWAGDELRAVYIVGRVSPNRSPEIHDVNRQFYQDDRLVLDVLGLAAWLVRDPLASIDADPKEWIDYRLGSLPGPAAVRFEPRDPALKAWTLRGLDTGDPPVLEGGGVRLDTQLTYMVQGFASNLTMEDMLVDAEPWSQEERAGRDRLTIEMPDGSVYRLFFGDERVVHWTPEQVAGRMKIPFADNDRARARLNEVMIEASLSPEAAAAASAAADTTEGDFSNAQPPKPRRLDGRVFLLDESFLNIFELIAGKPQT